MNQPLTLPAHLQGRQNRNLASVASEGIGGALPPHISIRGNRFTLVDGAGNKKEIETTYLDGVFADINAHMCKQFYAHDWDPDSSEPPTCFSMNGVAPSREAIEPQSPTCASCPQNVRGSDVSKLSGKAIKACRDEKVTAFVPLAFPGMIFQLKITPGSFKNWQAYANALKDRNVDLPWLVTRLAFEAQKNGVLTFAMQDWTAPALLDTVDKAVAAKLTDVLVGRNDVPRQSTLPPPTGGQAAPVNAGVGVSAPFSDAQNAGFGSTTEATASTITGFAAPAASPSNSPAEGGQRRKRRTKAEMVADRQQNAVPAAGGQPAEGGARAPFRPADPPGGGQGGFGSLGGQAVSQPGSAANGGFGISPGVEPNPEVAAALRNVFGT